MNHKNFAHLILLGGLFLVGCAGSPVVTAPTAPKYQLMLTGTIDGQAFTGVGIGSAAPHHSMEITSSIPVNYFTMDSCHRALQFSDVIPDKPWYDWSEDSRSFSWDYNEAPTLEDSGDCILRFCAYSKVVGSPPVACAIVDWQNQKYQLPAENICNGHDVADKGTFICHTKVGLLERMRFQGPVITAPQVVVPGSKDAPYWIKNQCLGKFLDTNQTLFEYQVPAAECEIAFVERALPHRKAKLTVIPYDTAQYQGAK